MGMPMFLIKSRISADKSGTTSWWEIFVDGSKTGYRYERVLSHLGWGMREQIGAVAIVAANAV